MVPERFTPVLDELRPLAERFTAAGYRLYLVGGTVRDLLLGLPTTGDFDFDATTDARPDAIKRLLSGWADAVWTQGERFGTIGAKKGERVYEITTHRSEAYAADSRKPEVTFGDTIETDLSRRDFTVNAMALELTCDTPELVDPFGGVADLAAGVLRTPDDPMLSFGEDPLRMLRAARFMSGYSLKPTDELLQAVRSLVSRLSIVSAERIRDELNKLMVVDDPSIGLWFLHDSGLSELFLPELGALRVAQDPIHRHKDVLTHTIAVVAKTSPRLIVRLAALFHDVGKPDTLAIGPHGVSFHHHEVVGARMTRERMRALRYPKQMVTDVSQLVYLHLRFHTFKMGWTDSAVRRFVRDAGDQLDELIELTRCDCTTRNKRRAQELADRMDVLEERIAALTAAEELAAIRPDLDGRAVMEHLGIGGGREVGEALAHLLELRLDQGPMDTDAAYAALDAWWAARNGPTA